MYGIHRAKATLPARGLRGQPPLQATPWHSWSADSSAQVCSTGPWSHCTAAQIANAQRNRQTKRQDTLVQLVQCNLHVHVTTKSKYIPPEAASKIPVMHAAGGLFAFRKPETWIARKVALDERPPHHHLCPITSSSFPCGRVMLNRPISDVACS